MVLVLEDILCEKKEKYENNEEIKENKKDNIFKDGP